MKTSSLLPCGTQATRDLSSVEHFTHKLSSGFSCHTGLYYIPKYYLRNEFESYNMHFKLYKLIINNSIHWPKKMAIHFF